MRTLYQYFPIPRRCLLVALALLCSSAKAESPHFPSQEGSIYGSLGSSGATIGYGLRIADSWAARVMISSGGRGKTQKDHEIGGIHYDAKARLSPGVTLLADFYPSQSNGFRLSGGLDISRLKLDLSGRSDGAGGYDINGHRYSSGQVGSLSSRLKYNTVKPYLGIGWESKALGEKGWRFVSDLGVLYYGKNKASLEATGAGGNSTLQRDLAVERNDLQKRSVGIALSLGAAYAF